MDEKRYTYAEWIVLGRLLQNAGRCHGLVVREGIEDACGKVPVAVVDGRDAEDEGFWPACAYHAHRWGRSRCVPLADIQSCAETYPYLVKAGGPARGHLTGLPGHQA